ncbi:nesprin-3 isoform 2-T2 [Rhinophrynus dorsalis]
MTQSAQDEFEKCMENAEAWMRGIHERLKVNDNTQGPRSALESRLRETEKISSLEPEGKLLVDMVLMKAEALLVESSEEGKHEIHIKLGKLKAMFEETTIYMTHCHSRIEWVWLHWNEYLKARDEFILWVHNMTLTLEPDLELQLGLKEKRWQYDQCQVLLRDVNNQSRLLDRLLEEAASLYNRIGDPSVDESVQSAMMADYKTIKKKVQERATLLENIMKEHEAYKGEVDQFRAWLNGVIDKLKSNIRGTVESTERRLLILQEISQDVESGRKQMEALDVRSAQVIKFTSPLGAEKICKELEELRRALAELKSMNEEEEEHLLKTHSSDSAFLLLAQELEANINEFRKAIQRLDGSLESGERVKNKDELMALWKTLNATKSALAAEEAKGERVKVQLKDLFRFSKDVQPLSEGVIAAMQEYQRAKSKVFKLSTETESTLIQHFQNPLREFQHWKPITERILDTTAAPMSDGALAHDCLSQIEMLLEESCRINDKMTALQTKREQMTSVLGEEKAQALLADISTAAAERASLHRDLLQRKNRLQALASQSKAFDAAFARLQKKVSALRIKAAKENELQPDVVGKETQLQRLQMLQDELVKLELHIEELKSMAESNPTHKHKSNQLSSEYTTLQRSLEMNIVKCKKYIEDHRVYNNKLGDLQHWMMVTQQELESYKEGSEQGDVKSREREIEILLAELSKKEIELHRVQAQGQLVMENSSPEGAAHIQAELKQLNASWASLKLLWDALSGLIKQQAQQRTAADPHRSPTAGMKSPISGLRPGGEAQRTASQSDKSPKVRRIATDIIRDTYPPRIAVQSDSSPASLTLLHGFGQTGNSSSAAHGTSLPSTPPQTDKSQASVRMNQTSGIGILQGNDVGVRQGESGKSRGATERNSGSITGNYSQGETLAQSSLDQEKPSNPAVIRRNQRGVSLAESVDMTDSHSMQSTEERTGTEEDHMKLLKEFELWLQEENSRLNKICSLDASSSEGMKTKLSRLQKLQSRVPQGQRLFEALLLCRPAMAITEDLRLEDLRYRWMLYKSKLRESGCSSSLITSEEPRRAMKKSSGGLCSFLQRVCCAALPLQLLLLLLLLLAFLLPLLFQTQNCALSNNFARSFNLMLRYERPPPI